MVAVDVLVFEGCEALDALGPFEVLRYGGLDVRLVTRDVPRQVTTAQGLGVVAQAPRATPDWLLVPGGGWSTRSRDPGNEASAGLVGEFLAARRAAGVHLATVCTGALWTAQAGLVTGRRMTTHHAFFDELVAFGVDVQRGVRVVDDGDLVSSAGITSGLFLALHLVERLAGRKRRTAVENEIELPAIPGYPADLDKRGLSTLAAESRRSP